ncbi:galectin, partial [Melanogaster broomeanus]
YTLKLGGDVGLNVDLTTDGIITFRSASHDVSSGSSGDQTSVNLNDSDGNRVLHLSFRRSQNLIVFNHKKNGTWGTEERVALGGKFFKPDTTVMVYDHGDRFQILIDYRTVHYFTKRITASVRSVSYFCNQGQTPVFSNTMQVIAYSSMGIIM